MRVMLQDTKPPHIQVGCSMYVSCRVTDKLAIPFPPKTTMFHAATHTTSRLFETDNLQPLMTRSLCKDLLITKTRCAAQQPYN